MKNIYSVISLLLFSALMYTSCTPDEYDLGGLDVKSEDLVEGIAYKVEHDVENPNIVYLTSLMDAKYTPLWNHPQGRSQEQKVTLKMPFDGTYSVQFGVQTRGGIVYGDTTEFTIADFYAGFVDNQLWTNLTGGVGNEKTWIQDNGQYGMAGGALAYADPANSQEFNKFTLGWEPEGNANETTDEEMGWGSTMTFSLKDGAFLTTNKLNEGGITESGTFLLNTDDYTLTTTDATILRPDNFIARASNWTKNIKILTLTENQLQIAIYRDYADEDPWWFVWNYVSKDYADAYDPSSAIEPEPPYDGDANNDLTTAVTNTLTWTVNLDYPYNWQGLDGADLNTVVSYGSDPDGFSFDTWAPPYDKSILEAISITLAKGEGAGGSYVIETAAGTFDGNYIIDESNNIDFGQSIPIFTELEGWLSFGTTADNSLKIIKTETDDLGNVAGLWLGQRSEEKKEYLSIHLKPTFNSGGENTEPQGTEIAFDNSKLDFGDIESNGNLRLELYNDYGSTASDSPLNRDDLVVNSRIEVTFTLGGITLTGEAAGSYNTAFILADADWNPQYWGDGTQEVVANVTGNGTYTVSYNPSSTSEGAAVFVIDIKGMAAEIADLTAVTATIDKIVVY